MWLPYTPNPISDNVSEDVWREYVAREFNSVSDALNNEIVRWDDFRTPAIEQALDSSSGRIDYDFTEIGVGFQANARYPDEPLVHLVQMPHEWQEGSTIKPHIHWVQNSANFPNWLMEYRKYNNGELVPGSFVQSTVESHIFTWSSGNLLQISNFPEIEMSDMVLSCFVDVKIYRDSANASGLFAGADPYSGVALLKEYDIHHLVDSFGSTLEFIKEGI